MIQNAPLISFIWKSCVPVRLNNFKYHIPINKYSVFEILRWIENIFLVSIHFIFISLFHDKFNKWFEITFMLKSILET